MMVIIYSWIFFPIFALHAVEIIFISNAEDIISTLFFIIVYFKLWLQDQNHYQEHTS